MKKNLLKSVEIMVINVKIIHINVQDFKKLIRKWNSVV